MNKIRSINIVFELLCYSEEKHVQIMYEFAVKIPKKSQKNLLATTPK
jgi:hypothetical protein